MTEEKLCEYCGCLDSEHDREQLARECYPARISRLEAELDERQKLNESIEFICFREFERGFKAGWSNALDLAQQDIESGVMSRRWTEYVATLLRDLKGEMLDRVRRELEQGEAKATEGES